MNMHLSLSKWLVTLSKAAAFTCQLRISFLISRANALSFSMKVQISSLTSCKDMTTPSVC